jgi:MFS family permease
MQSTAQGWLVLRLSDSPFLLGLVGFCNLVPFLLFALPAGVAADRLPRRRALMYTQGIAMIQAAILAALTWFGTVRVWHVGALAFVLGTVMAFDIPIRQSLLQDMVGRDDLPNAIAMNSLAFNSARLVGPALAGMVVAVLGESACFLINTVSFGAILAAIATIRTAGDAQGGTDGGWMGGIRDGLSYARRTPRIRILLQLVVVSSVFGMPYAILMPVFARDILDIGSEGLGFLMGASGLGSMIGALYIAGRKSVKRSGPVVAWAIGAFGAGLVAFSVSRSVWISLPCLVLVGAAMIAQMATSNALIQLSAPPALRGRVVSLYMLCFIGMAPLGSLLAGWCTRWIGTAATVGIGGGICLANALWFAWRLPALRRAAEATTVVE